MSGSTKRSRLQAFAGDADAVDLEVKQPAAKKARRVKVAKSASDAVASLVAQVNKNFAACSDSKKYGSLPKYQSDGKWQRRWKAVVSAFDNKEAETAKDCPDSDEIAGKPVAAVSDPTIPAGSFASFEEAKAAVKPALDVDDADSAEQMAMPSPFVQRRIDAMSMKLRANPAAFLDFDMTDTLVLLFEPNRRLLIRPLGMHETTIQGVLLRLVQSTLLGRRAGDLTLDMNEMSLVSDVCQVMEGHDHPVYCSLLETIQAHLARYDAGMSLSLSRFCFVTLWCFYCSLECDVVRSPTRAPAACRETVQVRLLLQQHRFAHLGRVPSLVHVGSRVQGQVLSNP
jgi:hypothetical protein